MNKTRRLLLSLSVLSCLLMIPLGVSAFELKKADSLLIEENINDNVYALANEITVNGKIDGDLICLTKDLRIKGEITGDVICATQNASLGGTILGDLRIAAGEKAVVSGKVKGNANVLSQKFSMPRLSSVGKSLLLMADEAVVDGSVEKNVEGAVLRANIAGHIGGDVDLEMGGKEIKEPLSINKQAYIGGNVSYRSANKKINISEEAYINKSVNHEFKKIKEKEKNPFGFGWFYSLVFCLLLGLLTAWLLKKYLPEIDKKMTEKADHCFVWGALSFILAPILLFFLLLTIVGIPLALLAGFLWLLILLLSRLLAGIWIGQKILKKTKIKKNNLFLSTLIGITTLKLITTIPYIGQLLGLLATIWALGSLWLIFKEKRQKNPRSKSKRKKKK